MESVFLFIILHHKHSLSETMLWKRPSLMLAKVTNPS